MKKINGKIKKYLFRKYLKAYRKYVKKGKESHFRLIMQAGFAVIYNSLYFVIYEERDEDYFILKANVMYNLKLKRRVFNNIQDESRGEKDILVWKFKY